MNTPNKFVIKGGRQLRGEVEISGAKNAVVAILPATILADEPCIVENVPEISDVEICFDILRELGASVRYLAPHTYEIDTRAIKSYSVP